MGTRYMKTLLKYKEAIHTPTLELAKRVATALHEDGYRWRMGDSLLDNPKWEKYRENHTLHIHLDETEKITYGSVNGYVKDNGYAIIPAEEFLERIGLPEKWCIKITKGNLEEVGNYYSRDGVGSYVDYENIDKYYSSHNLHSGESVTGKHYGANFILDSPTEEYPEITFEQFKKHILKPMKYKLKVKYPGSPKLGTITEEDMSKYPDFWEVVKEPYEIGTCLKVLQEGNRFSTHPELAKELSVEVNDKIYYNAPNTEYIKFVKMAKFHNCPEVVIGEHNGYYYAFDYNKGKSFVTATKYEYDNYFNIVIAGYSLKKTGSDYKFGCQTFNKEEVETIKRLLKSPINAEITISNTKITLELINKL